MANEAIANATAWTLGTWGVLVHPATGGDTTAPAAPTALSLSAVDEESISVAFTPPTDDDYSTCEFIAHCLDGGADGTVDAAASPAVITGLTGGNHYIVTATAVDSVGNRSEPVLLAQVVRTASAPALDDPMEVSWYLDRSATPHAKSPWHINAAAAVTSGKMETLRAALHAGQIKALRVRTRYVGPTVDVAIVGFALDYESPRGKPMGRGQE